MEEFPVLIVAAPVTDDHHPTGAKIEHSAGKDTGDRR